MKKFGKHRILIIGDIMLDRYIDGHISRISPEAPVPVLDMMKMENKPGGAANVALNIKSLGSEPVLLSVTGDDKSGNELIKLLENNNINTAYIIKTKSKPTTVKTRIMSGGQHLLRIDEEDSSKVDKETDKSIINKYSELLEHGNIDAVIIQDYDKGLLHDNTIPHLITEANKRGIFIAVDPKFDNFFSYANVDLFKPNLKETASSLNTNIKVEMDDLKAKAKSLYERLKYKHIFITLGDKGIFYSDGTQAEIVPTETINVVDVSGAGDVVLSVATIAFLQGYTPREVAHLSNIAGGLACGIVGVATISKEQLAEAYNKNKAL